MAGTLSVIEELEDKVESIIEYDIAMILKILYNTNNY